MESGLEVRPSELPEYNGRTVGKEHIDIGRPQQTGVMRGENVKHYDGDPRRYPLWIVLGAALLGAAVVGAALGGGLGSKLHNAHKAQQAR